MELTPIPDYGDLMTLEEFIKGCKCEMFTGYDGTGYLATEKGYDRDAIAYPSDMVKGIEVAAWATHVMWFNK